ncbi:unnamed protein product, partial [Closterium sp. NIES-53]
MQLRGLFTVCCRCALLYATVCCCCCCMFLRAVLSLHFCHLHYSSDHTTPLLYRPSVGCGSKICDPTTDCVTDAAGGATCVCKAGYRNISGTCLGPATCGNCPTGATCAVAFGYIPYCICPTGYGMTSTGCVNGATPTVSDTSFTFYDQSNYTITPNTYTMRLEYNGCTTIPSSTSSKIRSIWNVQK